MQHTILVCCTSPHTSRSRRQQAVPAERRCARCGLPPPMQSPLHPTAARRQPPLAACVPPLLAGPCGWQQRLPPPPPLPRPCPLPHRPPAAPLRGEGEQWVNQWKVSQHFESCPFMWAPGRKHVASALPTSSATPAAPALVTTAPAAASRLRVAASALDRMFGRLVCCAARVSQGERRCRACRRRRRQQEAAVWSGAS